MNQRLEALMRALDALEETETPQRRHIYESLLHDEMQRTGLAEDRLESMLLRQHARWQRAQNKPSSLPPKA